jgi:hypothetical protein
MLGPAVADPVNFQVIDYLADDLGLTGTRITEIGPRSDGSGNDNGDCDLVDWTKFQPGPLADVDGKYMGHFRDPILAGGSQPSFYSSPGYAGLSSMQVCRVCQRLG